MSERSALGLGPEDRLRRRSDFLRIYDAGRRVPGREFVLFYLSGKTDRHRLGLTVPGRLGIAVKRNRVKRRLRAIFRYHREEFGSAALDLVINLTAAGIDAPHSELEVEFRRAASAARQGKGRPPRAGGRPRRR
jgi:ribonuclease P protein component